VTESGSIVRLKGEEISSRTGRKISSFSVETSPTTARKPFACVGTGIRVFILILIGVLIPVVAREWNWWVSSSALQSTDDAYLQADNAARRQSARQCQANVGAGLHPDSDRIAAPQ
jgi:hypothetical protein